MELLLLYEIQYLKHTQVMFYNTPNNLTASPTSINFAFVKLYNHIIPVMSTQTIHDLPLANNHISVDCVVLGYDGLHLNVLLVSRHSEGEEFNDMKLPGNLIFQDEDLDQAATRVLYELTGLKNTSLTQFKAYGSKDRTRDPRDVIWLERAQRIRVERIVTIAYIAFVKIGPATTACLDGHNAQWVRIDEVGTLAFDHNIILRDSLLQMQSMLTANQALLYDLLPRKFTMAQLRTVFEVVYGRAYDVRNFHKKASTTPYIVALDEYEQGVAHRAARFYRFDRKIYNRRR